MKNQLVGVVLAMLAVALAAIPVSVVAAQAVRLPTALVVVDAMGEKIGNVISLREVPFDFAEALVAFEANGLLALIEVQRFGLQGSSLFFTLPDCEGDAFLLLIGSVPLGGLGAPGLTVYAPDPTSPAPAQTFQSIESTPGQCGNGLQEATSDVYFRAIPLINLEGLFTPPFIARPTSVKGTK